MNQARAFIALKFLHFNDYISIFYFLSTLNLLPTVYFHKHNISAELPLSFLFLNKRQIKRFLVHTNYGIYSGIREVRTQIMKIAEYLVRICFR